jgi:hypothetical protein
MGLHVEFLGKSERSYTGRDGSPRVARNVSVLTEEGRAVELFCSDAAYASLNGAKRGDLLEVVPVIVSFQGRTDLRVGAFRPVPKGA